MLKELTLDASGNKRVVCGLRSPVITATGIPPSVAMLLQLTQMRDDYKRMGPEIEATIKKALEEAAVRSGNASIAQLSEMVEASVCPPPPQIPSVLAIGCTPPPLPPALLKGTNWTAECRGEWPHCEG